jgi:hypothetical protein
MPGIGTLVVFLAAFCFPAAASAKSVSSQCDAMLVQRIPARESMASSGHEFVQRVEGISGIERDAVIRKELLAGNLPRFLRELKPVTLNGTLQDGRRVAVTLCVAPDYLAVGSNRDFVRVPMGLAAALSVASHFGFVLPTRKMVDAIYRQSSVHLKPQPLPAGPQMRSTDYLWEHEQLVDAQRQVFNSPLGALTAGQKKDLVLTNRLWSNPGRVAIYGWHKEDGRPIQPLSLVHGARYADYSHGVRLVSSVAYVNGKPRSIVDLLKDPQFAGVLSDEGSMRLDALMATLGGGEVSTLASLRVGAASL